MEPYCEIRANWDGGEEEEGEQDEARLGSFEDLISLLKQVRDRHADELADARAEGDVDSRDVLGGKTVEVTNRWGSVAEVGLGRDVCFFCRLRPRPGSCYSDHPPMEGTRVFYLDGYHHTELGADALVSRDEFLRVLRRWLEEDDFPEGCGI